MARPSTKDSMLKGYWVSVRPTLTHVDVQKKQLVP